MYLHMPVFLRFFIPDVVDRWMDHLYMNEMKSEFVEQTAQTVSKLFFFFF
jgi:hypothetical protein